VLSRHVEPAQGGRERAGEDGEEAQAQGPQAVREEVMAKFGRQKWKTKKRPYPRPRNVNIVAQVVRGPNTGFVAIACLKTRRGPLKSCGIHQQGRSPQSAIAKAVADLSRQIAKRGRKFYAKSEATNERRAKRSRGWYKRTRATKRNVNLTLGPRV
jgi:ribosome-associated translation inhibitor RaiA